LITEHRSRICDCRNEKFKSSYASEDFSLDEWKAILVWKKKASADSITISYRVLPFFLSRNYAHKSFARLNKSDSILNQPIIYSPDDCGQSKLPSVDWITTEVFQEELLSETTRIS